MLICNFRLTLIWAKYPQHLVLEKHYKAMASMEAKRALLNPHRSSILIIHWEALNQFTQETGNVTWTGVDLSLTKNATKWKTRYWKGNKLEIANYKTKLPKSRVQVLRAEREGNIMCVIHVSKKKKWVKTYCTCTVEIKNTTSVIAYLKD